MSLSPDVTPFVPRLESNTPPANALQKLSADVAEFVPSWLNSKSTIIETTDPKISQKVTLNENATIPQNLSDRSSLKKKDQKQKVMSRKKIWPKQNLDPQHVFQRDLSPSKNNVSESMVETDFPTLGSSYEQNQTLSEVWNTPFGVSFSEKLKSGYRSRYDIPSKVICSKSQRSNMDLETDIKEKAIKNKQAAIVLKGKQRITLTGIDEKPDVNITDCEKNDTLSHDDNKRVAFPMEGDWHNEMNKKFSGRQSRSVAWEDNSYSERSKQTTPKQASEFSQNRNEFSEKQNHGTNCDALHMDVKQRHISTSQDLKAGKNNTNKRKATEPRKNDISTDKGSEGRQSVKPTKDYSIWKSTDGVFRRKKSILHQKATRDATAEEKYEHEDDVMKRISPPSVEIRALSYSDILKSKPNIQLPDPDIDRKATGFLRIPTDVSVVEEMDAQEEGTHEEKTKKKKKKKKKSTVETPPQPVKKSKETLVLDFGDVLTKIMEESSSNKKAVIRTGGCFPLQVAVPQKESRMVKKTDVTHMHQAANALDSTAPIVFRSKEREFPKKKKPSAMRKILTKERENKKLLIRDGKSSDHSSDERNSENESADEQKLDSHDIDSEEIKKSIHSRKFREYCDQDLDYDINGLVIKLLKELIRFQDRLYHKDPIKAKARRRFVCGLREVHKHAKLKKLKCVIVTPNLEPTKSKGGLDDLLSKIIDTCHAQNVPVIFSLNRQVLGKVLLKKVPVSIVGIFYYDGAQDYFKRLMQLTEVAQETYRDKFNKARENFILEKKMKETLEQIETAVDSAE